MCRWWREIVCVAEYEELALALIIKPASAPSACSTYQMSPSNPIAPSPKPFIQGYFAGENESALERAQREQEAAEAMAASNAIDEGIKQDRVNARGVVRVVVIGESESGKSTIIRKFFSKHVQENTQGPYRHRTDVERPVPEDVDRAVVGVDHGGYIDSGEGIPQISGVQESRLRLSTGGLWDWIFSEVPSSGLTFRNAWAPYFDNADSVIFLVPVNCFDEYSSESPGESRLEGSLRLWKQVCNCKLLEKVQLIPVFTKTDLMKEKLDSGIHFGRYVSAYGGRPNDLSSASSFLLEQFGMILKGSSGSYRHFSCHFTSATDMAVVQTIAVAIGQERIRRLVLEVLDSGIHRPERQVFS